MKEVVSFWKKKYEIKFKCPHCRYEITNEDCDLFVDISEQQVTCFLCGNVFLLISKKYD